MWSPPDRERLSRLRLSRHAIGKSIIFCPMCDFQMAPDTVCGSECPDCRHRGLHVTTVSAELVAIAATRRAGIASADTTCPRCGESTQLAKVKGCIVCLICGNKMDCNGW